MYVTKNTLTAYTIAIVQNTQALQYDQMHSALQTARNQASIETLLRVEELMTTHFNLAVLANEKDVDITPDAQKPEATTQDTEPSASAANDQTYVCRREYSLVNGIPAGYESDDSWDNDSHTHEHTHTHNIVPLLALRTWNNRPHRGRELPHRQNNNINMRTGHAPYSRPWDNQPCVNSAKLSSADAQHLRPGRHAHQYHQCLPILVTNKFPSWWQTNHCNNCIYPCSHLPTKKRMEKLQRFAKHLNITG